MRQLKKLSCRLSAIDQRRHQAKLARNRLQRAVEEKAPTCNYKASWWTRFLRFFLLRKSH